MDNYPTDTIPQSTQPQTGSEQSRKNVVAEVAAEVRDRIQSVADRVAILKENLDENQ